MKNWNENIVWLRRISNAFESKETVEYSSLEEVSCETQIFSFNFKPSAEIIDTWEIDINSICEKESFWTYVAL